MKYQILGISAFNAKNEPKPLTGKNWIKPERTGKKGFTKKGQEIGHNLGKIIFENFEL